MVKEILVDRETRWECVSCGKCCYKIGDEFSLKLFGEKTDNGKCVKLSEKNRCGLYRDRPLGCKMYPFYPDWNKLKLGNVSFKIGSLKMDSECSGYMKGTKIINNKKLFKKLNSIALEIRAYMIKNPGGQIKDIFGNR